MKIVYSYYVMDICHRGHLLQMKNAKATAGKNGLSVVGILTKEAVLEKKEKKPILSFDERMNLAQVIEYNDLVIPQDTYSPLKNIKNLKPDVAMESESHSKKDIKVIEDYMSSIGGRVLIMPYYPYQSSTSIKKKISGDSDSVPRGRKT